MDTVQQLRLRRGEYWDLWCDQHNLGDLERMYFLSFLAQHGLGLDASVAVWEEQLGRWRKAQAAERHAWEVTCQRLGIPAGQRATFFGWCEDKIGPLASDATILRLYNKWRERQRTTFQVMTV